MKDYDNNGQSAAKSLSLQKYEKGSTTISWKESTLNRVETAHVDVYTFNDKLPQFSGIYGIYCITNNKIYIGSAINIHARYVRHKYYLSTSNHHSTKLQRAFNKYGIDVFRIIVIEKCTSEQLLEKELSWINKLDSYENGFNATLVCRKPNSFKLKQSQIEKRSEKSSKPVICLDIQGNYLTEYKSVSEAAIAVNDQSTNISACCKKRLNYIKDCIFVYKSEYNPDLNYAYTPSKRIFSEEHKQKISKGLKGLPKTQLQLSILKARCEKPVIKLKDNVIIQQYSSMKECCKDNKLQMKPLKNHIISKTPLKGFIYTLNEDIV